MSSLPNEMIDLYVHRRHEDVRILRASLDSGCIDEVNRIGHQIAGNARSFGFPELERIGEKLESLTKEELPTTGEAIVLELRHWTKLNPIKQTRLA